MKGLISSWIVAGLAIGVASPAMGEGYLNSMGAGVTPTGYMMNNLGGNNNYGLTIFLSGILNPDSCNATDKVHIRSTAVGYKEMVAAVMAAKASGNKIGFYSSGCQTIPFWGGSTTYPIVTDLWVVD
jgi:hypothetical protein